LTAFLVPLTGQVSEEGYKIRNRKVCFMEDIMTGDFYCGEVLSENTNN
jgi:hypothetical protein